MTRWLQESRGVKNGSDRRSMCLFVGEQVLTKKFTETLVPKGAHFYNESKHC